MQETKNEWDNWEHDSEEDRFEYFKQMFSAIKKMKDILE